MGKHSVPPVEMRREKGRGSSERMQVAQLPNFSHFFSRIGKSRSPVQRAYLHKSSRRKWLVSKYFLLHPSPPIMPSKRQILRPADDKNKLTLMRLITKGMPIYYVTFLSFFELESTLNKQLFSSLPCLTITILHLRCVRSKFPPVSSLTTLANKKQ